MTEAWHQVPGWEGIYEALPTGAVRRIKPSNGARVGRILKPRHNRRTGYYSLMLSRNNKPVTTALHVIIAATFLGPKPKGYQVNHKNGNKADNSVSNLEYVTPSENQRHSSRMGIMPSGERQWQATFSNKLAASIRKQVLSGPPGTAAKLARFYGVCDATISCIKSGKTYKFDVVKANQAKASQ